MKKLNLKKVTILNFSIKNSLKGGVQTIEVNCDTSFLSGTTQQSTGPTEPQSIDSMDGISGAQNCMV